MQRQIKFHLQKYKKNIFLITVLLGIKSIIQNTVSLLRAFLEILRRLFVSSCLSVRLSDYPHQTIWFPLDGFSWNLMFEDFLKICLDFSSFIEILQE
jgi:hypothetical protein